MKICMLVPNDFSNDPRVLKEAMTLQGNDHVIDIVAFQNKDLPDEEVKDGINVSRIGRDQKKVKNSLIRKFYLVFVHYPSLTKQFSRKCVSKKPDVVHCHDLEALIPGWLAKRRLNCKLVYDSHEFAVERNPGRGKITKLFIKTIERFLIKKCDLIITVNDSISEQLSKRYRVSNVKVVHNYPVVVETIEPFDYRHDPRFVDRIIVIYQGRFMRGRGLEQLIDSFKLLSDEYVLILRGFDYYEEVLREKVKNDKLDEKVIFLDRIEPDEVLASAAGADIGVSPITADVLSYYYSSPQKIFEYMMSGIAVACSHYPEVQKVIDDTKCGATFDPYEPESIADAISWCGERSRLEDMKVNSRNAAVSKYNWNTEQEKLIDAYSEIIQIS